MAHRALSYDLSKKQSSDATCGSGQARSAGEFHRFGNLAPSAKTLDARHLIALARMINATAATSAPEKELLNSATGDGQRPGVPAGYTYLFQLAAHDLTHTSLAARSFADNRVDPINLRRQGLQLETVFGGGAEGCPFAYDRATDGRDRLRLGQVENTSSPEYFTDRIAWSNPVRDLPRMAYHGDGRDKPRLMSDVLIPDPRNDDNNLLAQMTVVFHRLYNRLVENSDIIAEHHERARIARFATVRIYRRILREDLLKRLLLPEVHERYAQDGIRMDIPDEDGSVTREFAFAVGRVAHAMVRDKYKLNSDRGPVPLQLLIAASSLHLPGMVPTPKNWVIDWSLFFAEEGDTQVPEDFNWALRFGPHVAPDMTKRDSAPAGKDEHPDGTPFRDLVREHLMDLAPLEELCEFIAQDPVFGSWEYFQPQTGRTTRRDLLDKELRWLSSKPGRGRVEWSEEDHQAVLDNPPLWLFLKCEARALGQDGARLGPLGSILLAEAMWAAFSEEQPGPDVEDAKRLEAKAFEGISPATMPQLLSLMTEEK
ncbi:MAG: hypothetical protein GJ676_03855 [Rhodobacteraceae bacterium]|nr:hypothetical protein [Paracoccaceae bacterium]